ncbi:unnamed protein product [Gongylonema pulchrum]|uniref:Transposase n=1 Tax=Gongylonema pulchrum TaxID=637853 RepID=A0A183E5B9_9BILA|nr:unnamed protein product [Gongylonema pulchrum]
MKMAGKFAVRDVAAALSNLIQATKNASGRSLHDPAMGHLKEAAKVRPVVTAKISFCSLGRIDRKSGIAV